MVNEGTEVDVRQSKGASGKSGRTTGLLAKFEGIGVECGVIAPRNVGPG